MLMKSDGRPVRSPFFRGIHAVFMLLGIAAVALPVSATDYPVGCDATRADDLYDAVATASASSGNSVSLAPECVYTMAWNGSSQASVDGSPTIFGSLATDLTIHGNGSVIERADDMQYARFFYIGPGGSLTLDHLSLRNGTSRGDDGHDASPTGDSAAPGGDYSGLGGAIYNNGVLVADAVIFDANKAIGGNGGCSQNGGTGGAGGAGLGGAIFSEDAEIAISRSTFLNNVATGGAAGSYGCPAGHVSGAAGGGGGGKGGAGAFDDLSGTTGPGSDGGYGGGGGGDKFGVPNGGGDGGFGGGAGAEDASAGEFGTAAATGGFSGGSGAGLGGSVFIESVRSGGSAQLINNTFYGNLAIGADSIDDGPDGGWGVGGAVFVHSGTLDMTADTVALNSAQGGNVSNPANAQDGGSASAAGIYVHASAILAQTQSIVTTGMLTAGTSTKGNSGTTADPDVSGALSSQGYNLVTTRGSSTGYVSSDLPDATPAGLSTFDDHGGATPTFLPEVGSAAIDAVPSAQCAVGFDQRGDARPFGAGCDIGSVEVNDVIFADGFE